MVSPTIIIEEVARGQWHALCPDGEPRGVQNWCEVISYALLCATLDGHAVESVALGGERLTLMHAVELVEARR